MTGGWWGPPSILHLRNFVGLPLSSAVAAATVLDDEESTFGGGDDGTHQQQQQCPQWVNNEIQQCVQPVAEFARTLNRQQLEEQHQLRQHNSQRSAASQHHREQQASATASSSLGSQFGSALQWPTKMGGQVFRELCRLINDFELCVDGYRDRCGRHITIGLIEASYGFLCNEGYETFMASAECLMELDQRPSVKQCHDRTLSVIEEANNDRNGTVMAKLDRMCSALNYFSDCVRPPITHNCGLDAWKVIFRVLKDTSRTLMPMCHFDEYEEEEDEGGGGENNNSNGDGDDLRAIGETKDQKSMSTKITDKGNAENNNNEKPQREKFVDSKKFNEQQQDGGGSPVAAKEEEKFDERNLHNAGDADYNNAEEGEDGGHNGNNNNKPFDDWERWEEEEGEEKEADTAAGANEFRQKSGSKNRGGENHFGGAQEREEPSNGNNNNKNDDSSYSSTHHQIHYGSYPLHQSDYGSNGESGVVVVRRGSWMRFYALLFVAHLFLSTIFTARIP